MSLICLVALAMRLLNVIESATFHCFLQLREQEVARCKVRGVGRVWEGRNVVFRLKFIFGYSPVSRGTVMVQDPIVGTPILRAMSTHSVAEALQDCFVEFLIYRQASRDVLMMTSPSMSKNAINMVLTLDFTCRAFFGRGDDAVFHWEDICFVSGSYP